MQKARTRPSMRLCTRSVLGSWLLLLASAATALSAPQAAHVIDVRTGAIYHSQNADQRLHPASLTKMMTLYVAFHAIERGLLDLDNTALVSAQAAAVGGSSLGLAQGHTISIRHLIRATAVRSANDAAVALAEAVSGTEQAFVEEMNLTAEAMGLEGTRFRNSHGLTAEGHLSTARDMSELGRRLHWDFPEYWALYGQITADAGVARVSHTNRRFLSGYSGADGIKTGYTRAAGYNLTASARRGDVHLIATVFGATSSADRAARVAALLDRAFAVAPSAVAAVAPQPLRNESLTGASRDDLRIAGMFAARPLITQVAHLGRAGPEAALTQNRAPLDYTSGPLGASASAASALTSSVQMSPRLSRGAGTGSVDLSGLSQPRGALLAGR